jgi:transglutaminase-like putative cysteine protease
VHYQITHTTLYRFSRPVNLGPHEVRLTPRTDAAQRVLDHQLHAWPQPAGTASLLDAEGNCVTSYWWEGMHRELAIESYSIVETLRDNPFDFLLVSDAAALPVRYSARLLPAIGAARQRPSAWSGSGSEVARLVAELCSATDGQTMPFLLELTHYLFRTLAVVHRRSGLPKPPAETLTDRGGACRDLAILFMDVCRAAGLAARFISGYSEGHPDGPRQELHAWAEVYLPGGGWRGFDPTTGLAVADRHMAVAAAVDPRNAAPITGTYYGSGVSSEMTYEVNVTPKSPTALALGD